MARRTTPTRVREAGGFPTSLELDIFIDSASKMLDKVVELCPQSSELDDQQLELIETWLACHFVAIRRPSAIRKKIGAAETEYERGRQGVGLDATTFGQQALALDTSGCLRNLGRQKARVRWVGSKANDHAPWPVEQPPERNYTES